MSSLTVYTHEARALLDTRKMVRVRAMDMPQGVTNAWYQPTPWDYDDGKPGVYAVGYDFRCFGTSTTRQDAGGWTTRGSRWRGLNDE